MSLVGLDLNATRLRGVASNGLHPPARLALEREAAEFPLALSLEGRSILAGSAGQRLTRLRPHLACVDFLPHLGTARQWNGPKLRVTAEEALRHCLQAVGRTLNRITGVGLCVPGYLSDEQVQQMQEIFRVARLPLMGLLRSTQAALLARSLAGSTTDSETPVLIVDVDGHALTWSVIDHQSGQPQLLSMHVSAVLSRASWLRRLVDGVAGRFIRQSRHDPRESGETEQAIYEQVCKFVSRETLPSFLPFGLHTPSWSCHLMIPAEDLVAFVGPCLRQAALELDSLLHETHAQGGIQQAILTGPAAALPGLADLVRSRLQALPPLDDGDYGEAILHHLAQDRVVELGDDDLSVAACELAKRIHAGQLPRGFHDAFFVASPQHRTKEVGPPQTKDVGPPRLQFRGQDHLLQKKVFLLGRDPACDLVFESELYPHVSAR
ncbi:MAG: Hsp70 family protein, partial [Gemmataceae bacterium]